MTKFIGRKFNIGIGKETTRGVATAPQYGLPKMSLSIDDKINFVTNESSYGVIEDAETQDITSKYSEGTIEGRITDQSIGLLLLATLGAETSVSAVETGVKDHGFYVGESAQHQSLTIAAVEPNSNSGAGFSYNLAMIEQLDIEVEIGKYAMYKAAFRANAGAAVSSTISYTSENAFRPQDGIFKLATNLAGLGAANAIQIKKSSITIKKNTEDDVVIGSVTPADRYNKQFSVEGTVELLYDDRTQIDTNMMGDLAKALRLQFINTSTLIGATAYPTLTFDLAKVKLGEVARNIDNDGIVSQVVKFKAFWSLSDAKMINVTLRNNVASAY